MRSLALTIVALLLAWGCGSSQPSVAPGGRPAPMAATRASADDAIVATVNGRPVWGSCVANQAARGATKTAALNQCVDFELLAQAADKRGYAGDAEVARATHTTMVSELVASAYEAGYQAPAQFGAFWQKAYKAGIFHIRHENYRASSYVRLEVKTPAEADAQKAIADRVAAALANETGLTGTSLLELAQTAAGPDVALKHEDVTAYRIGALDPAYGKMLFGDDARSDAASSVVRTKWGWDVIVWTDDVPAADPTEAEVTAALLPEVKVAFFGHWVDSIAGQPRRPHHVRSSQHREARGVVTVFASILKTCVDQSPGAIGGAFADSEGEMVDSYSKMAVHDWAVLTAHYGVVMAQLHDAFGTLHFGGPEFFIARHDRIEVVVHDVEQGYYVLLAFREPPEFDVVLDRIRTAVILLKKEMQ